jgi:hypothetical protein
MALDLLRHIQDRFSHIDEWGGVMDQTALTTAYLPRHDIEAVIYVFVHAILVHEYEFCKDEKKKLKLKKFITTTFGMASILELTMGRAALLLYQGGPFIPGVFQATVEALLGAIKKQWVKPPATDSRAELEQEFKVHRGQAEELTYGAVLHIFEFTIEWILRSSRRG